MAKDSGNVWDNSGIHKVGIDLASDIHLNSYIYNHKHTIDARHVFTVYLIYQKIVHKLCT